MAGCIMEASIIALLRIRLPSTGTKLLQVHGCVGVIWGLLLAHCFLTLYIMVQCKTPLLCICNGHAIQQCSNPYIGCLLVVLKFDIGGSPSAFGLH